MNITSVDTPASAQPLPRRRAGGWELCHRFRGRVSAVGFWGRATARVSRRWPPDPVDRHTNCAPGQAACRLCWAQAYLSFYLVFHDRDWQKSKTLKASGRSPETPGVLFSISHRHGRTERSARKSQGFRPPGPAAPFPPLVVPVLRVDGGAVLGGVRRAPRARARAGHNGRARLCAHATGTGHAMRRRVIYSPSRR